MNFFKWCVAFLVALFVVPGLLRAESPAVALPLALALVAGFALWRMAEHRFDPYHSVRLATTAGYVSVAAAMLVLAALGNTSAVYWTLVGVVFTAALVARSVAQEQFLRSRDESWVAAGRGSFAERAYLRTVSPPVFRWLHRIFAFWWVWSLVTYAPQQQGPDPLDGLVAVVLPGFLLLLGGPFVALFYIPLFFLALGFLAWMPGLLWLLSSLAWVITTGIRSPTDRRTNHYRAFRQATHSWPWYFMT